MSGLLERGARADLKDETGATPAHLAVLSGAPCHTSFQYFFILLGSVADPDPYIFGPPGSESVRGVDPDPDQCPSIIKQE
jgi:hypothetical protein